MPEIPAPPLAEARTFLRSVPLFRDLDEATLDEMAGHLEWLLIPGGQALCRQGEDSDGLYLVVSGRLSIVRELPGGEQVVLNHVGRGDSLGEVAALTGNPRSATIRALRDSVLARLARAGLDRLLESHPKLILAFTRRLATWIGPETSTERGRGCVAVAVTATHPETPLAEVAARLAAALSRIGPVLRLTSHGIDRTLASDEGRLGAWIDEQESCHSFLLYEADPGLTPWTRRCLRQADRVLVVVDSDDEPSLGELGGVLERCEGRPREELVLLHLKKKERPRGTARWLGLHTFLRHHHIRMEVPADFDRLARFVNGTPVGLVLGGGGARGFAHIGVIRALQEAGIPIDRVGGTSMGAVMAGLHARGFHWKDMVRLNRWGWVRYKPHKLYTLPIISLLSSRKAERMLDMMFGDDQIEDLWLPFFCVSTNLTQAEVVIHRYGEMERQVGASMRLPGIVPPMVQDGNLLVDGGVLNNLPIDVMRRQGRGPIIAVDVSAAIDVRADPSYQVAPSPWQLLVGQWRKTAKPFPNILQLLHRSAVMASDIYARQSKHEVELYIDLPMERFDLFNVEPLDEIVELGYRFTQELLGRTRLSEKIPLVPPEPAPPARTSSGR
ncbi:MAG TPA: patatin-like phospholipase family protein [Thermoanaerobaculia bacterium]|jgi:predicted acylesterase/phospholipase RssA/CRP-like cAMP-binding protein|nr:patatin-like phospholipase family protein [Thermoanaerobaculia bacterium]